jgi:hypothetical protein
MGRGKILLFNMCWSFWKAPGAMEYHKDMYYGSCLRAWVRNVGITQWEVLLIC